MNREICRAPDVISLARRAFRRRLAGTYQQAVRARAEAEEMPGLAAAARARLAEVGRRGDDEAAGDEAAGELPMARLARRLALQPRQVDLVWAIVASSVDGRIVPHLEAIGG